MVALFGEQLVIAVAPATDGHRKSTIKQSPERRKITAVSTFALLSASAVETNPSTKIGENGEETL
jgi:hypothetical protein